MSDVSNKQGFLNESMVSLVVVVVVGRSCPGFENFFLLHVRTSVSMPPPPPYLGRLSPD